MLIQSDKSLLVFLCLQAKLQLFKIIKLCCSAQAIEKFFWQLFNLKKLAFSLLQFCDVAKARKKPSLKLTEQKELNKTWPLKLTSMLSKFLQTPEQMRLNIGKKLKTASLN